MAPDSPSTDRLAAQREVFGRTLVELIEEGQPILVLDGDLANSTKTDIVATTHPERFLMMGIAEQNMTGVAAGLATMRFIPWVVSFASFVVNRDLDQIRVVVAQPKLNVKLAGSYAGLLTGRTGKTHQDVWDLAVMRAIPNMTVLAPADALECAAVIRAATKHVGPVYVRLARDAVEPLFDVQPDFLIGPVHPLRSGSEVLLVSTGTQTARTAVAAEFLRARGIDAGLLHVPTIKPLDPVGIARATQGYPLVVTTEEHSVIGGLGSAVAEVLAEVRPTHIRRIGIEDRFGESAANDELLERFGLSAGRVADQVAGWLRGSQG